MGLFGNQAAATGVMWELLAEQGIMPLPELVRRVHQGDSARWHEAAQQANGLVTGHDDAGDRGTRMLRGLESAWTGDGAEAAADKIRAGLKATQTSSEVYGANARQYTDSAHAFDNVRSQLTAMDDQAPERSAWDNLTPWDTDQEDKINQYKAQLEQNRQTYQAYEQTMKSSQQGVQKDFGSLGPLDGGLGKIDFGTGTTGKESSGTGVITFNESGGQQQAQPGGSSVTPAGPGGSGGQVNTGGSQNFASNLPAASQPDDSTSAAGYTPPGGTGPGGYSPNVQTPGYQPGSGQGSNFGSGNAYAPPGFGPPGGAAGGRFSGPGAGGASGGSVGGVGSGSGSGSGGAAGRVGSGGIPGGAAGGLGAGKGTGAAPFGPGGQAGGAVGGSAGGSGGARGMGGMGAMGGGAGRGRGSDDEEHQRQYVQDTDEAFSLTDDDEPLRDPNTGAVVTPPTIGG
ncbi:hypothetical protein [Prauserella cavernicola]|uniref:PPE domain-containing protein n=1 Tax=Prauserella cavernicola TaxID=2800127 RepID=A0A934V8P9_9PSEU|nr:hypothetical protein [Prauserella cavernicola]MBK1788515.1 hypothetical protein [Prauserella cavernicola]